MKTSTTLRAALVAAAGLVLAACGAPTIPADTPAYAPAPGARPTPLASPTCNDAQQSYTPSSTTAFPSGSLQSKIKSRGKLIVGVSGDSLLLGARDPANPSKFSGFDIDLARAVAKAIFGSDDPRFIQFRVITAAQRIPLVNAGGDDGGVDLVARNMTVTCDRWNQVAFSAVYFKAEQRILVRRPSSTSAPEYADVAALVKAKARVCAPAGSTSIQRMVDPKYAGIVPVQVDQHTTCLALLQEGRVEAITGDSTVLAGLNTQDPKYTTVLPGAIGEEPYGLAVGKAQRQFAAYVNAVLAEYVASGGWQKAYDTYFATALGPATPPAPQYGRS